MFESIECPNCGEVLCDDDLNNGVCPGCGLEFEVDEAA